MCRNHHKVTSVQASFCRHSHPLSQLKCYDRQVQHLMGVSIPYSIGTKHYIVNHELVGVALWCRVATA